MTNRDMVKNTSPKQAGAARRRRPGEVAEPEHPRHMRDGAPVEGAPVESEQQFPPSEDPLDSNQLKPMINARKHPGLKRPPE